MENNFNLKKFLIENKLTSESKKLEGDDLINFLEQNKEELSKVLDNEYVLNNPIIPFRDEDGPESPYDDYNNDDYSKDLFKYSKYMAQAGEELATATISSIILPDKFACLASGWDTVFFGAKINSKNPMKKININGITLYATSYIPDPGSN